MRFLTRTLHDPFADCEAVRRGRYGVIEIQGGRLAAIYLRAWPKIGSALEVEWFGHRTHSQRPGDRCWLYYNQPWRCPNFLAVVYAVSRRDCTLATIHRALDVLDEVARIKWTDSMVCDVWNARISDRLLVRRGWEPHKPERWHRNYIKRFYGTFPAERAEVRAICPGGC